MEDQCGSCRRNAVHGTCYKPPAPALKSSVPIIYHNKTNCVDFEVIVFASRQTSHIVSSPYVAWQVLRGQSSVSFIYPLDIQVGASYTHADQQVTAGPFCTYQGSTWEIVQNNSADTAELKEGNIFLHCFCCHCYCCYFSFEVTGVAQNEDSSIVIVNSVPHTWSGRKFNVGIYKNNKLFMIQNDIHVGDKVTITINPMLYFAVTRNFDTGEKFTTFELMTHIDVFDLTKFPNGMEVSLVEQPGGGKYKFIAQNTVISKRQLNNLIVNH